MKKRNANNLWQKKLLMLIGSLIFLIPPVVFADIAVIVHPSNGSVSLTRSNIQEIFMAVSEKLPNGTEVSPIDQSQNQPIRQSFYELVAGKSPVQMQAYWARLIFTGKGNPPPSLPGNAAVIAHIASNSNAIGYVDSSAVKGSANVKTVFIIPTQ